MRTAQLCSGVGKDTDVTKEPTYRAPSYQAALHGAIRRLRSHARGVCPDCGRDVPVTVHGLTRGRVMNHYPRPEQ